MHGKNKEGWWGYDQFEEQVVDVMDCIDVMRQRSNWCWRLTTPQAMLNFERTGCM